jgi:hypothetical protein
MKHSSLRRKIGRTYKASPELKEDSSAGCNRFSPRDLSVKTTVKYMDFRFAYLIRSWEAHHLITWFHTSREQYLCIENNMIQFMSRFLLLAMQLLGAS